MNTTVGVVFVACVYLIIEHVAEKGGHPLPRPSGHTLIALAIFAGLLFVSCSLDSVANAIGSAATAWREFNETVKSMKKSNGE